MSARQGENSKVEQVTYDKIARTIFAAAESVGISDRNLTEQLTEQVIQRLERLGARLPLPGMEGLIPEKKKRAKSSPPPEIEGIVKEALTQMGHPEIAKAYLKEQKPQPVRE